jgi:hypothetical protein
MIPGTWESDQNATWEKTVSRKAATNRSQKPAYRIAGATETTAADRAGGTKFWTEPQPEQI